MPEKIIVTVGTLRNPNIHGNIQTIAKRDRIRRYKKPKTPEALKGMAEARAETIRVNLSNEEQTIDKSQVFVSMKFFERYNKGGLYYGAEVTEIVYAEPLSSVFI